MKVAALIPCVFVLCSALATVIKHLEVTVESGLPFVIESSTNCTDWSEWTNGTGPNLYEVDCDDPHKYFRLKPDSTNL